jgi:hypothetical protein
LLDETSGVTVTSLFPHFVDAQQSAMRGLNIGWYAIDQDGEIASGPYRGRNECVIGIGQWRPRSLESALTSLSQGARNLTRVWPHLKKSRE